MQFLVHCSRSISKMVLFFWMHPASTPHIELRNLINFGVKNRWLKFVISCKVESQNCNGTNVYRDICAVAKLLRTNHTKCWLLDSFQASKIDGHRNWFWRQEKQKKKKKFKISSVSRNASAIDNPKQAALTTCPLTTKITDQDWTYLGVHHINVPRPTVNGVSGALSGRTPQTAVKRTWDVKNVRFPIRLLTKPQPLSI